MSTWFRMYAESLNDPKVQTLHSDVFKAWINILCLAASNDGKEATESEICFALRLSPSKAKATVWALKQAGLLDGDETGYLPHNWNGRQFKSDVSNERVKRFRKRQRNDECNVTSNNKETPPDTETESEQSRAEHNNVSRETNSTELDFEFWYDRYPRKVAKPKARKAYFAARKKTDAQTLLAGVESYRKSKPDYADWAYPASWLNGERWLDELTEAPKDEAAAVLERLERKARESVVDVDPITTGGISLEPNVEAKNTSSTRVEEIGSDPMQIPAFLRREA